MIPEHETDTDSDILLRICNAWWQANGCCEVFEDAHTSVAVRRVYRGVTLLLQQKQ
jgi:hypothetical protein